MTANGTSTPSSTTPKRTKICVYCGSSPGNKPEHVEAARELARLMAANNIALGKFLAGSLPFSYTPLFFFFFSLAFSLLCVCFSSA